MKLKFERFEGLCCFSVRGEIPDAQLKIIELGIETLVKKLEETLIINLALATFSETGTKHFLETKKKIANETKHKIFWVTKEKGLGDFQSVSLLTSRLSGFKPRQIGERIQLEDDIFVIQSKVEQIEKQIVKLGGDQDRAHQIILENRVLKQQERVLKEAIKWHEARLKLQVKIPSVDEQYSEKLGPTLAEFQKLGLTGVDV